MSSQVAAQQAAAPAERDVRSLKCAESFVGYGIPVAEPGYCNGVQSQQVPVAVSEVPYDKEYVC